MEIHDIGDIFTPTRPARKNFIKRQALDKRVSRALKTPGMQVILYGHSGSGKTTLLLNKLKQLNLNFLKTNCTGNMSFDDLLSNIYLSMNKELSTKVTNKDDQEGSGTLRVPAVLQFGSKNTTGTTLEMNYVTARDAIELSLARTIGEHEAIWVIEDFHKLQLDVKTKLAQLMKVFMDLSDDYSKLKIVALGAKNTAREVVELDAEMQTRVSEIHVPLMNDEEIKRIVNNGAKLLNIQALKNVVDDVVEHSHGVASICHHLCLLMCECADIDSTDDTDSNIQLDFDHFNYAASEYIQQVSDTLKSAFQKSIKIDNSYEILSCLAQQDIEGVELSDIETYVNKHNDKVEISLNCLNGSLGQLSSIEHGSVLLFDEVSEQYTFKDPFYKMFAKLFLQELTSKRRRSTSEYHQLFNKLILSAKRKYVNPNSITSSASDAFESPHNDDDEASRINNKWKKSESKLRR